MWTRGRTDEAEAGQVWTEEEHRDTTTKDITETEHNIVFQFLKLL